jgi:hypothetical protein
MTEVVVPGRSVVVVLGATGGTKTMTKAQRQFNKLVERLKDQREELARWQAFKQSYQQQLASKYQPLAARLREKRIAMVILLDRAVESNSLSKRDRGEVLGMLSRLLLELLAEAEDAELVRLHDKYADVSFEQERRNRMAVMRELASEDYGIDVGAYEGAESPEELADWLRDQVRASRTAEESADVAPDSKKSAKALAREALREQAEEGGSRAVRDVFRKLVSELHPDRETDPAAHARKTELMQRVNQAYEAGDLLTLLELQLSFEESNAAMLAGLAKERLRHFVHVLEAQSQRLRADLAAIMEPFAAIVGDTKSRKVTADAVQRTLEADIREIKSVLRTVEFDLVRFRDIRQLKHSLR